MKVGDRITYSGSDQVWIVEEIREEEGRLTAKSFYSDRKERFRISECKKTQKNPALLIETFGGSWRKTVHGILTKNKIRFFEYTQERQRDATKFWVDAKKLSVAKSALDKHYEDEKHSPTQIVGEPLTDDEIPF